MRRCWLALLVGLVFVVNPSTAFACSCPALTKPELVGNVSVIFTGTVTGISRPFHFGLGCAPVVTTGEPVQVTVEVETVYKGHADRQVVVSTLGDGPSCGYEFKTGHRYTVFATGALNKPETNLCRGNVEGAIAPSEYGLSAGRPPG